MFLDSVKRVIAYTSDIYKLIIFNIYQNFMLYHKMRHPWCNFALTKKCRDNFLVRKMTAQLHSNFASKY